MTLFKYTHTFTWLVSTANTSAKTDLSSLAVFVTKLISCRFQWKTINGWQTQYNAHHAWLSRKIWHPKFTRALAVRDSPMVSGRHSRLFCERNRSVRLCRPEISSGNTSKRFSDTSSCVSRFSLPISYSNNNNSNTSQHVKLQYF